MDDTRAYHRWNKSVVTRINRPIAGRIGDRWTLLAGSIVLTVVLGGLSGLNPSIGVAGAALLLLLAIVWSRPILIVYGLTVIGPLTGGLARGAVIPVLRIGQALVVLGFILFILSKPGRLSKSRLTSIDLAFAFFIVAQAVFPVLALYYRGERLSFTDTNNIYGVSPIQTLLGPFQYYILYRVVVATVSSLRQAKRVLELSFIASILVSAIGIVEEISVPFKNFIQTYYPAVAPSTDAWGYTIGNANVRLASTLQHYSGLGAYLTFTMITALACYTRQQQLKIASPLLVATMLVDSVALVLTGTFAAWIGLAIGAIGVFILSRRIPPLVYVSVGGIAIAAFLFQPFLSLRLDQELGAGAAQGLLPQSFAFRINLWVTLFLPAIGQHVIFGVGPAPPALAAWSTEESYFLRALLRGGLVFLASYLLLIKVAITLCHGQLRSLREDAARPIIVATLVILVVINIMNVVGDYFTYAGGIESLWTLLALVVAIAQGEGIGAGSIAEPLSKS